MRRSKTNTSPSKSHCISSPKTPVKRYPPIIQSTTNQLSVVFRSNGRITRTGFMAHYRILKGNSSTMLTLSTINEFYCH
ncbi:hypothetical protein AC249_AIPGENE609 [Exaiptasia diaphana]|nr:hypothetical protein AC249_AIPGENE609 [Exaiptasia diaphana]